MTMLTVLDNQQVIYCPWGIDELRSSLDIHRQVGTSARLGYQNALAEFDVPFDESLVMESVQTRLGGAKLAGKFGKMKDRPTAAVCLNDILALGFMAGLRKLGITPGSDVAVIGNEDIEEAELADPSLSSSHVGREKMGQIAAQVLLERIEDATRTTQEIVLKSELIIRESSGGPI